MISRQSDGPGGPQGDPHEAPAGRIAIGEEPELLSLVADKFMPRIEPVQQFDDPAIVHGVGFIEILEIDAVLGFSALRMRMIRRRPSSVT